MSVFTDIGCGHHIGDACCVLSSRHDGDHKPSNVVVVDRRHQPLNGRRVRFVGKWKKGDMHARVRERGRIEVSLMSEEEDWGTFQPVNRPAVKVNGRWLRRCPQLEVVPS